MQQLSPALACTSRSERECKVESNGGRHLTLLPATGGPHPDAPPSQAVQKQETRRSRALPADRQSAHTRWITCGGRDLAHHARPCRHDHLVRAAVQRASRARHRACSAHPFLASPSARDFAHPVAVVRPLGQAWAEIERSAARGCTRAPGPHPAPSRRSDECGAMPLLCRCCASPSACSGRRRPGREYCEQPCSASG